MTLHEGKKEALAILKDPNLVNQLIPLDPTPQGKYLGLFAKFIKNGTSINELTPLTDKIRKAEERGFKQDISKMSDPYHLVQALDAFNKIITRGKMKKGIEGLTEGEDYAVVFEKDSIVGYTPFNWKASRTIASSAVGTGEGEWCIAYQKDKRYWNDFGNEGKRFVMFINYGDTSKWIKYALEIYPQSRATSRYQFWSSTDHQVGRPDFISEEEIQKIREILRGYDNEEKYNFEVTRYFEISGNCWAEEEDGVCKGSVYYSLSSFTPDGDYEEEDSGDSETYTNFTIQEVGRDVEMTDDTIPLYELDNFSIKNGNGIYVEYDESGITPEDAESNATRKWSNAEMRNDMDAYEITKVLGEVLTQGNTYEYIIIKNNNSLDDFVKDLLDGDYFIFQDRTHRQYGYGSNSNTYDDMEAKDYENNEYTILYKHDYNYSKNDEVLASTAPQRKRDRQLDLEYGL